MPNATPGRRVTAQGQLASNVVGTEQIIDEDIGSADIGTDAVDSDEIKENAVGASELADNAVDEAAIADDAVGLPEMKAGTQGGIIHFGASGAPTELSAGNSGQFLQTKGASANPVWASPAGLLHFDASTITISNSNAEANIASVSIPANTLGTDGAIRITLPVINFKLQDNIGTKQATFLLKYGATTLCSFTTPTIVGSYNTGAGEIKGMLFANGATNAQQATLFVSIRDTDDSLGHPKIIENIIGSATEDSTGALNLVIALSFSDASVNNTISVDNVFSEVL